MPRKKRKGRTEWQRLEAHKRILRRWWARRFRKLEAELVELRLSMLEGERTNKYIQVEPKTLESLSNARREVERAANASRL